MLCATVPLADVHGSSDLFGYNDTSEVVDPSYDSGSFHDKGVLSVFNISRTRAAPPRDRGPRWEPRIGETLQNVLHGYYLKKRQRLYPVCGSFVENIGRLTNERKCVIMMLTMTKRGDSA